MSPSHHLKGLEGVPGGHQSPSQPWQEHLYLCHSWQIFIFAFLRPSVLEMLPAPRAVSCSVSLTLSQEGFNLNLSYCNLSPLLLVLSARGMENWLFLSSLQQYFTYLRIVLLTQTLLGTEHSLRRRLSPHRWNQTTFGCNVQWQHSYCKFTLQNELKTEMKPHWKFHIKGIYIPFLLSFKLQTRVFLTYM